MLPFAVLGHSLCELTPLLQSPGKSHPLCQFIYVNIHTCMCMHAYIFLYVLALVFRTFSTSFLQDHLRRFLWVAYCQPRLLAWLLTARPLLFGFQFLFVFVLWATFPVDSLACLLLGFYLPEMSNRCIMYFLFCKAFEVGGDYLFYLHGTLYKGLPA